ncbi:hypothetical protein Stsp01_15270 [Streptomyces sp. NBRC 13847]|nr:hypothetical protein Stsp01_15270 [Streptomyces sp. NBRC 13847]
MTLDTAPPLPVATAFFAGAEGADAAAAAVPLVVQDVASRERLSAAADAAATAARRTAIRPPGFAEVACRRIPETLAPFGWRINAELQGLCEI